jgi:hypothetical protein
MTDRLAAAFARIDAANADDPNRPEINGVARPYAVFYGERMTSWLDRLVPEASDPLKIAVRAQHIRRFDVARSAYPMDKPGYFAWRNALKDHHATLTAGIMADVGYDEDDIARMRSIIRKERLKRDAEAQALEDCACLVFLENEFMPFAERHTDDKIVDIVAKTWVKMSDAGHAEAVAMLPALPERLQTLVLKAVKGD